MPERRLARAKTKLATLVKRGELFSSKKPYAFVTEDDRQAGHTIHKVIITRKLPQGTQDIAWEIVEELRSALDQIGYACAVADGKVAPKNTYFPIAYSATKLETDVINRGRCKDIPPSLLDDLSVVQALQGSDCR